MYGTTQKSLRQVIKITIRCAAHEKSTLCPAPRMCCSRSRINVNIMNLYFLASYICTDAAPTRQDLQPRDGYVPVYVRVGDEPLAKINPDLAEAFNEPTENSKVTICTNIGTRKHSNVILNTFSAVRWDIRGNELAEHLLRWSRWWRLRGRGRRPLRIIQGPPRRDIAKNHWWDTASGRRSCQRWRDDWCGYRWCERNRTACCATFATRCEPHKLRPNWCMSTTLLGPEHGHCDKFDASRTVTVTYGGGTGAGFVNLCSLQKHAQKWSNHIRLANRCWTSPAHY